MKKQVFRLGAALLGALIVTAATVPAQDPTQTNDISNIKLESTQTHDFSNIKIEKNTKL